MKGRQNVTKALWSARKVSGGILAGIEKKKNALIWERRSWERCDCDKTSPKEACRAKSVLRGTSKTSGGIVTVAEGFREGQTKEGSRA